MTFIWFLTQVQQSYVSFQQALAALPASVPTGLITGVRQQRKSALIKPFALPSSLGSSWLFALVLFLSKAIR